MTEREGLLGVPISELLKASEGRLGEKFREMDPSDAWIKMLGAMQGMTQLFQENYDQENCPVEIVGQVLSIEKIFEAFEIEATQSQIFRQAAEQGIGYGELLHKLEEEGKIPTPHKSGHEG